MYENYLEVLPITEAVFEMGKFDTQVLAAVEKGKPLPQGTGYQQGPRYGHETQRAAVFTRDHHTCQVCGKGIREGRILRVHHIGFQNGDHSDRMDNLLTVCTKCHTPKNHKKGGKLWDFKPKLKPLRGATFMTMVRWNMMEKLKKISADHGVKLSITYGAATKLARKALSVKKTHANDAWSMGRMHPRHRSDTVHWKKRRRNNRVLEKFYDAVYIDSRDGSQKKGAELSCGRTNRSEPRNGPKNERCYRKQRLKKGKRSIRTRRYALQPHDIVWIEDSKTPLGVKGVHCKGTRVTLQDGRSIAIGNVQKAVHCSGWYKEK